MLCLCLPERLREWNKIASSHITEIGWQAGWPHKSCSHLMSGLLTCILNDFHIKAFAGNLLCHSKGFLPNWDRTMNALFYLAHLEKQNPPLHLLPLHLELLFETPYEGRYALKKQTGTWIKKISNSRIVYSLETRRLDNPNSCSLPAHTSPALPLSLLLWSHAEWSDTAGKETGSLWDLLLTLLQCNGPPSSCSRRQHPHTASLLLGPGTAPAAAAQPAPPASLHTCPLPGGIQTLEECPWRRESTMVGLNQVQCGCSQQLPLSSLCAQPLGAWTLRTQQHCMQDSRDGGCNLCSSIAWGVQAKSFSICNFHCIFKQNSNQLSPLLFN